jgi:hypothetical protein
MYRSLAVVAVLATPSLASADRFVVGAGVGETQTQSDAVDGTKAQATTGLFGRVRVLGPFAVQAEVGSINVAGTNVHTVTGDAMLVFGIRHLHPYVLAGAGVDQLSSNTIGTATTTRVEAGVGVEYHFRGGLSLGAELREGSRSVPSTSTQTDPPPTTWNAAIGVARFAPNTDGSDVAGGFRTVRLTLGIAF